MKDFIYPTIVFIIFIYTMVIVSVYVYKVSPLDLSESKSSNSGTMFTTDTLKNQLSKKFD